MALVSNMVIVGKISIVSSMAILIHRDIVRKIVIVSNMAIACNVVTVKRISNTSGGLPVIGVRNTMPSQEIKIQQDTEDGFVESRVIKGSAVCP